MFICIDAHYDGSTAHVAGIVFRDVTSNCIEKVYTHEATGAAPYSPGNFYKRELSGILGLLKEVEQSLQAIIIDGYVWLSAHRSPGLGAHLFSALGGAVPVIGVAKNPYKGGTMASKVLRNRSKRPLFVTAEGMPVNRAARLILEMHGPHRLPTLIKQVDAFARRQKGVSGYVTM